MFLVQLSKFSHTYKHTHKVFKSFVLQKTFFDIFNFSHYYIFNFIETYETRKLKKTKLPAAGCNKKKLVFIETVLLIILT